MHGYAFFKMHRKYALCESHIFRQVHDLISYIARSISMNYVKFEVFTAVTMKNGVFWDVTLCGSCKNRRFGRT
jgi:E3 ubiquitin-protein ligase DOA10